MAKTIDLTKTVYELIREYPELIDIMARLGFTEVTKPAMLNSVGKLMTIPRGAGMKHISMTDVITALWAEGFALAGGMPQSEGAGESGGSDRQRSASDRRTEQLKGYLRRLGDGEDLESVRADFVKNFSDVEASEIMRAEQELMEEGTPLAEVQRLCDIHSALFHGATAEEKIANAEKAVAESFARRKVEEEMAKRSSFPEKDYTNKNERAAALEAMPGHPLCSLKKENDAFAKVLESFRKTRDERLFAVIREVAVHYAKKGDLLYPQLKVKYGISGPSEVMWTVDDEIRDELGTLAKEKNRDAAWHERLDAVLKRAEEMIYKEQNILFPICAVNFTQEEWFAIYQDAKDYAECFGVAREVWKEAEEIRVSRAAGLAGEIVMPGGHMTPEQLTALLNTIPLEISFIDEDNINRFFNEGPKVFKRPAMAIDREVFSCHPPKIEPMVRSIIEDFRSGKRDRVPVWLEKNGRCMLVTYMAVRDRQNTYLGTVELVQDMEFAREHFSDKRKGVIA